METPGKRLRQAREALGLIRDAFGEKVGMKRHQIEHYERRAQQIPPKVLKLFEVHWGINPEWLKTGVGRMFLEGEGPKERPGASDIHGPLCFEEKGGNQGQKVISRDAFWEKFHQEVDQLWEIMVKIRKESWLKEEAEHVIHNWRTRVKEMQQREEARL